MWRAAVHAVVVTHRPAALELVQRIVVVDAGRVVMDGPRDQVLAALSGVRPAAPATRPSTCTPPPSPCSVPRPFESMTSLTKHDVPSSAPSMPRTWTSPAARHLGALPAVRDRHRRHHLVQLAHVDEADPQ